MSPPDAVLGELFAGKLPVDEVERVAAPSRRKVISTVVDSGGMSSLPAAPQLNTTRRGGSTAR